MKVLWTTLARPDPIWGGAATHAWELLSLASREHQITLLHGQTGSAEASAALVGLGLDVRPVQWQRHKPASRLGLLREAVTGPGNEEFRAVMPGIEALRSSLVAEQRRQRFDLVFVWGSDLAPLLGVADGPTAQYVTDACVTYARRLISTAPSLAHKLLYSLDWLHVRRWESTLYAQATALATPSPVDAETLRRLTGRPVALVPVALNESWFAIPASPRQPGLVTIVAGLDYWPNVDGIGWFLERSWPLIRAAVPETRLRVVGRSPDARLRASIAAAGAELIADVSDARPYYWEAAVAVLPLRIGSGIKNKLMHAFACGAPVVGTRIAIEGTATQPGIDALVAEDPEALAAAVIATLRDPAEAARRAGSARGLAEPFRADRVGEALADFWQSALANRA